MRVSSIKISTRRIEGDNEIKENNGWGP